MLVLGLDLATRLGWALCDEAGRRDSGAIRLLGASHGERFLFFCGELARLLKPAEDYLSFLVAYEEPIVGRGISQVRFSVGLATLVITACERAKVPYTSVAPSSLKKVVTGNGRADKLAMCEAAQRRWGRVTADDNEADALAVCAWALKEVER